MKTKIYIIMLFFSLLFSSCSNNDETSPEGIRQNSCDLEKSNGKFTECCVEGPLTAKPESVFFANYTTTILDPIYKWEVLGGSIEIIEGVNSATAKFRTKANFVLDTIVGESYSVDGMSGCSDLIVITAH